MIFDRFRKKKSEQHEQQPQLESGTVERQEIVQEYEPPDVLEVQIIPLTHSLKRRQIAETNFSKLSQEADTQYHKSKSGEWL